MWWMRFARMTEVWFEGKLAPWWQVSGTGRPGRNRSSKHKLEETGRPQWVEYVTEEAEILGTTLTRSGRIGTKQTKPIPLRTRTDFHVANRMLANSVASHGVVTKAPSETLLNIASSKIWSSKRLGLRGAAKHLKWDGRRCPAPTLRLWIASRLFGIVYRLKQG